MKIYLAGPEVFLPDPIAAGAALKALCTTHGAIGLFPMDNEPSSAAPGSIAAATHIRAANMALIAASDAVVANMAPFRGVSMDVGTAYEMGAAAALGKVVVGYTDDGRSYVEKVKGEFTEVKRGEDGYLRDGRGWSVEEFGGKGEAGLVDNLMISCGVEKLCGSVEEAIKSAVEIYRKREAEGKQE